MLGVEAARPPVEEERHRRHERQEQEHEFRRCRGEALGEMSRPPSARIFSQARPRANSRSSNDGCSRNQFTVAFRLSIPRGRFAELRRGRRLRRRVPCALLRHAGFPLTHPSRSLSRRSESGSSADSAKNRTADCEIEPERRQVLLMPARDELACQFARAADEEPKSLQTRLSKCSSEWVTSAATSFIDSRCTSEAWPHCAQCLPETGAPQFRQRAGSWAVDVSSWRGRRTRRSQCTRPPKRCAVSVRSRVAWFSR